MHKAGQAVDALLSANSSAFTLSYPLERIGTYDRQTLSPKLQFVLAEADDGYDEVPRECFVDDAAFNELSPEFLGTYFEHVFYELTARFAIGRVRILSKGLYNCNSWHRDPEPRLHIPIITKPGSLFIVNHHVTHLPAASTVYLTETSRYHTPLHGGETHLVHHVAPPPSALVIDYSAPT